MPRFSLRMMAPGIVGGLFKPADNRIFDTIKVEQFIHKHFSIHSGCRGRYLVAEWIEEDDIRICVHFEVTYTDLGIHVRAHGNAMPDSKHKARARMILAQMKQFARI
jgi:hypothetical protein